MTFKTAQGSFLFSTGLPIHSLRNHHPRTGLTDPAQQQGPWGQWRPFSRADIPQHKVCPEREPKGAIGSVNMRKIVHTALSTRKGLHHNETVIAAMESRRYYLFIHGVVWESSHRRGRKYLQIQPTGPSPLFIAMPLCRWFCSVVWCSQRAASTFVYFQSGYFSTTLLGMLRPISHHPQKRSP